MSCSSWHAASESTGRGERISCSGSSMQHVYKAVVALTCSYVPHASVKRSVSGVCANPALLSHADVL
jgi:hypothetical protein